mgnify:CR=1 FL=1
MKDKFNKFTDEKIAEITETLFKELDTNVEVLYLHRLISNCFKREYTVDDLYQLTNRSEDFKKVWILIRNELECRLLEGGSFRTHDSGFNKFVLSANYGMKEKSEVTTIEAIDVMPEFGDE